MNGTDLDKAFEKTEIDKFNQELNENIKEIFGKIKEVTST